jgi:Mg2+-importing ATPase
MFAIRTRRVPFWRSRPSTFLLLSVVAVVAAAALLRLSPIAGRLQFVPLGGWLYVAVGILAFGYVALVDAAKATVFRATSAPSARAFHAVPRTQLQRSRPAPKDRACNCATRPCGSKRTWRPSWTFRLMSV